MDGLLAEMQAIAQDTVREMWEVEEIYEKVYRDLASHARITEHLTLFVAKKVKQCLRDAAHS